MISVSGLAQAPPDSVLTVTGDTVEVISDKPLLFAADVASTRYRIDGETLQSYPTVADLLKNFNGTFVKSYGGSEALQSIGLRGASSSQTLMLIDGVPVNSPQNGGYNVGQMGLAGVAAVDIYSGGNSTLFGSGAIGGVVNTSVELSPGAFGYRALLESRSFGVTRTAMSINVPLAATQHHVHLQRTGGDNHYRFQIDQAQNKRQNSDFRHFAGDYLLQGQLSARHKLLFHGLFNRQRAGSPAAVIDIAAGQGNARIVDQQQMLRLKWQSDWHPRFNSTVQLYDRREWNDYRDPDLSINSRSLFSSHQNRTRGVTLRQMMVMWPTAILHSGLEFSHTSARSTELSGVEARRQYAGYVLMTWQLPVISEWKFKTDAGIRLESYSDFGESILPRGGVEISRGATAFYASLGKNFRAPTLNDLFWNPGGNPLLQPENSIAAEAGMRLKGQQFFPWRLNAAVYRSEIDDFIRWVPTNTGIWQPQNIETVLSRGLEVNFIMAIIPEKLTVFATYTNNLVTKRASRIKDDPTIGNRLPYSPRIQYSGRIQAALGKSLWAAGWQHSGYRFTTLANDPARVLAAYSTLTAEGRYSFAIGRQMATVFGQYNNVLREAYQLINRYPLPLFTWRAGIELTK